MIHIYLCPPVICSLLWIIYVYILSTFFRTAVSIANIATTSSLTASNDDSSCQNNQETQASEPSGDNSSYRNHNNEDHNHFTFSNLHPNIWPGHDRKFKSQESDNKFSRFVESIILLGVMHKCMHYVFYAFSW